MFYIEQIFSETLQECNTSCPPPEKSSQYMIAPMISAAYCQQLDSAA